MILQFDDFREVGEKTDGAFNLTLRICDWREIDPDALVDARAGWHVELDAGEDFSGFKASIQKLLQRLRLANQIPQQIAGHEGFQEDSFAGRIVAGDSALAVHGDQAAWHFVCDLRAERDVHRLG